MQNISLARIRKTGIAKEETENFKASIDDLKESYTDVENVFFVLPADDEFAKITKELNLI